MENGIDEYIGVSAVGNRLVHANQPGHTLLEELEESKGKIARLDSKISLLDSKLDVHKEEILSSRPRVQLLTPASGKLLDVRRQFLDVFKRDIKC